jgi:hypothetical protein
MLEKGIWVVVWLIVRNKNLFHGSFLVIADWWVFDGIVLYTFFEFVPMYLGDNWVYHAMLPSVYAIQSNAKYYD